MATKNNPDFNHNLLTDLSPSIKTKITQYRLACEAYAFAGSAPKEDREGIQESLQIARYDLEATILTHLDRAAGT